MSSARPLVRHSCFLAASLLILTLAYGCGGDDEKPSKADRETSGGSAGDDGGGDAGGAGTSGKGGTSSKGGTSGEGGTPSDGASGASGADGGSGGAELYFPKLGIACEVDDDCMSGQICIAGTANDPFFEGGPAHGICTVACSEDEDCGSLADCFVGEKAEGYCMPKCGNVGPFEASDDLLVECHARNDLACRRVGDFSACIPVCGSDLDCPKGRHCSLEKRVCVDEVRPGKALGAKCTPGADPDECGNGFCLRGNAGGVCSGWCTLGGDDQTECGDLNAKCAYPPPNAIVGELGACAMLCKNHGDCAAPTTFCGHNADYCAGAQPCPNGQSDCGPAQLGLACVATKGGSFCLDPWKPFGSYDECTTVGKYSICSTTVTDTATNLTWARHHAGFVMKLTDAEDYCAAFGARLPSYDELMSLLDATRVEAPYISVAAFPTTPDSVFWAHPMSVNFGRKDGDAPSPFPDEKWDVRCVLD